MSARQLRLMMLATVAAMIGAALLAAMLQGPQMYLPLATFFVMLAAVPIDLVCRLAIKLRGGSRAAAPIWAPGLMVLMLLGGLFAVILLGVATGLAYLLRLEVRGLLLHAEMLLLVYLAVTRFAVSALFNLVRLFRPAAKA